jgi:flagellar hook-length control protein FliK
VASHLTVTSTTQTGTSIRAFGSAQSGDASASGNQTGVMGLFSALLGGTAADAKVGASSQQSLDLSLLGLTGLSLDIEGGAGTGDDGDTASQDALAAALDLNLGATAQVTPAPLVDFIDAMTAIKVNLSEGGPVDPALLEQLNAAMAALAETLGIDLDAGAKTPNFAELLGKTPSQAGFASLLENLDIQVALRAGIDAAGAQLGPQLQASADKLAALLGQMSSGGVDADLMARLGLVNGQVVDADVDAALTRLATGVVLDAGLVPQEPDLAAPALKITETVLTGKDSDAAARVPVQPTAEGADTETGAKDQKQAAQAPISADAKTEDAVKAPERQAADAPQRAVGAAVTAPADDAAIEPTAAQSTAQASLRVDAAAPRVVQAGYQTSQQQLNLPQIAFELARQVTDGNTRFQIRLDPPELGRIDVRLDIDKAGQVNARLVVEKAETLDLMQRDQRGLERALQQAGIDSGKTNLEFSLKQNPFVGQDQHGDERQTAGKGDENADGVEETPAPTVNLYRGALQARGVNIIA